MGPVCEWSRIFYMLTLRLIPSFVALTFHFIATFYDPFVTTSYPLIFLNIFNMFAKSFAALFTAVLLATSVLAQGSPAAAPGSGYVQSQTP